MSYSGAKASFNSAAEAYDTYRPTYPPATIRRIIQRANLNSNARILDVGAGTGKASILFAKHGYQITCLEPGAQMGEILKRNLGPYPNAKVVQSTFENWRSTRKSFDLLISAQAFHWIDPDLGFPLAAKALKPGGWIALFWNLPNDPEDGIYQSIQRAYRRYAPDLERRFRQKSLSNEVIEMRGRLEKYAKLFPTSHIYKASWRKSYTADTYLGLLGTYSDHIALPKGKRVNLYSSIKGIIERNGGKLVKHYSTMLAMAQTQNN